MRTKGNSETSGKTEVISCETKRAILEAARGRFLHYGYKKTTIDEIAAAAGVGKGTVYLYFNGKEDILTTIAVGVKRNITEQMRAIVGSLATPEEKLRRMMMVSILSVHEAVNSFAHGVELVDEMLQPRLMQCGQPEREAQLTLLVQVLEEGVERGDFGLVAPAPEAARFLQLAMVSFFPPYANPCHGHASCRHDLERRTNAMLDFLFTGLRRR